MPSPNMKIKLLTLGEHIFFDYTPEEITESAAKKGERLPCPFCGDDSTGFTHNEGNEVVMCLNCGAMGPQMRKKSGHWNEDDFRTLTLWNSRFSPEQVSEMEKAAHSGPLLLCSLPSLLFTSDTPRSPDPCFSPSASAPETPHNAASSPPDHSAPETPPPQ